MSGKTKQIEKPLINIIDLFLKQSGSFVGALMEDGRIRVFSITDPDQKNFIAAKLGKVLSNKRKALNLTLEIKDEDSVELCIFQQNAKADMLKESYSLKEGRLALPDLNNLLVLLAGKISLDKRAKQLEKDKDALLSKIRTIERDLYFISEPEIMLLESNLYIDTLKRNQILYTYKYYISTYDTYAHMIDDSVAREKSEHRNQKIKPFIDILTRIIESNSLFDDLWYTKQLWFTDKFKIPS